MRLSMLLAAPALALALSACNGATTEAAAPDPAVIKAEVDKAVADALAARDAEAVALHADAAGPKVYFVNLRDGQTVPQSFRIVFGVSGIGVAPALVDKPNTGHHHLLIDTELSDEEKQFAIPNDEKHMHFGGGQTEVVLQLAPGPHTLQLAFGDLNHELHKPTPIMSEKITVNVQ
jgi:hypothetical protein